MTSTTDRTPLALPVGCWDELLRARQAYADMVAPAYDEVLEQVADRIAAQGSVGKADIGALVLWKRLSASTPWAGRLGALPDAAVRGITAAAVTAVRDTTVDAPTAAARGRSCLRGLPGFTTGDAMASAVLTAAAPRRMAVYDRRAHAGLRKLNLPLDHGRGRYGRYLRIVEDLLAQAPSGAQDWVARDVDLALYWLGRPVS